MPVIYVSVGKGSPVSEGDYEHLNEFKWFLSSGYAVRCGPDDSKIRMHREIMGLLDPREIDHIDGNKLNNCRENLRFCEHHQNMRNLRPRRWLKYKGVSPNGKWFMSRIRWSGGNEFHLGTFSTEEAAARAYDKKANELDPQFARLNFDDGIWTEQMLSEYRMSPQKSDSGIPGVYTCKSGFYAAVKVNGKSQRIGTFKTKEEALAAREAFLAKTA